MVTGEKAERSGTDVGRSVELAMRRGDGFLLIGFCFVLFLSKR